MIAEALDPALASSRHQAAYRPHGLLAGKASLRHMHACRAQCTPEQKVLGWCAFGISADGSGNMVPAEIFMLTVDASSGQTWVEDRQNAAYQAPACYALPLSYLISATVSSANVLTASWTRPLVAPASHKALGYVDIIDGWSEAISATMSNVTGTSASARCRPAMPV